MFLFVLFKFFNTSLICCGQSCVTSRKKPRSQTYIEETDKQKRRICCFCITRHREIFQIYLFLSQVFYIIIHNGNVLSDFVYVSTVPSYNAGIEACLILFLLPSILIVLAFSIYGRKWKLFFLKLTGSLGMHMLVSEGCESLDPIEKAHGVLGAIFLFQTGPQLIIQTANTFLIGQTLTKVQMASPMFAILTLIEQFAGQWSKKGWARLAPACVFLCFLLPAIIIFFSAFYYEDRRPLWAKIHDHSELEIPLPLIGLEPIQYYNVTHLLP